MAQVKERGGGGEETKNCFFSLFHFLVLVNFSRDQNRKSPSTVPFCSETKQKRLLRRLDLVWLINVFRKGQVGSENRSKVFSFVTAYTSLKSIPASFVK